MIRPWITVLVAGSLVWIPLARVVVAQDKPIVQLASEGRAKLPIVVVDSAGTLQDDQLAGPAITDLLIHLNKLIGGTFEMEVGKVKPSGPAIVVGLAEDLQTAGVTDLPVEFPRQGCTIDTRTDGSVVLVSETPRGVSHAIYSLLHELGIRWFWPGETWTCVPDRPTVSVALKQTEQPSFPIQRRIWVGHGLHSAVVRKEFADWQRRNRMAQPFEVRTSHTWFGLNKDNDFAEHPEWFAEVKGERKPSKPAYTHPGVILRGIRTAIEYFNQHPDRLMISMSPPDGLGFDTSAQALEHAGVEEYFMAHGVPFGRRPDGTLVAIASEQVFHFVNEVARALQKEHPGRMVGILSYSAYAHPPSFDIEPNVYVELTRGYRRTPLSQVEQIEAFAKKSENLGIYEYYDVEQWSWDRPGRARACDLGYLESSLDFYRRNNITSLSGEMSENFGPNGVGYYVIARKTWNADIPARQIEQEFYDRAFGPAAGPVKRMYRRWESGLRRSEMALVAAYRNLAEATALTEPGSIERKRVNMLKMYLHFLKIYLQPERHGTGEDDVAAWIEKFGEEEARQRIKRLGIWVNRLHDTHLTHSWAFNRYFVRRSEVAGLDVSTWRDQPGPIPTDQEMEQIFEQDLEDLADAKVPDVPATLWSDTLVPVANASGVEGLD